MIRLLSIFSLMLLVLACKKKDDDAPSPRDTMIANLTAHSWQVERVMHQEDGDLTDQYTGFLLTLRNGDGGDGFIGPPIKEILPFMCVTPTWLSHTTPRNCLSILHTHSGWL